MNKFELRIYLGEGKTQCSFALAAAQAINRNLDIIHQFPEHGDRGQVNFAQRELFRSVHSLLTHASNVSKLFWPAKKKGAEGRARADRGEKLREAIPIIDELECIKNRAVRDHLEHFDERIDSWRSEGSGYYGQDNIGPIGMMGIEVKNIMRHYDDTTNCFVFRGESFDVQGMVLEVDRLYAELCIVLDGPHTHD